MHDSLIEQRIKRERPCRTLFIRNIKVSFQPVQNLIFRRQLTPIQYETDSEGVRKQFEEFGEIKTFFDLISNRGMVFVTYVSISHAVISINV